MPGFYPLDAIMEPVGLAAKLPFAVSVIVAIAVVTVGGTFLGYGRALESDGMPTMARVVEWTPTEVRYRYRANGKEYENTDKLPKGFTGIDGIYVRVTYLGYRPDIAHIATEELAARGAMILMVGIPLCAIWVLGNALAVKKRSQKGA
jgi:hypothetical protein